MWLLAALTAPVTGGASLVTAGVLEAAMCAADMFETWEEYERARALSAADLRGGYELDAVEFAVWTRPSTVDLVRSMAAQVVNGTSALVPAQYLSLIAGLALGAVALAVEPERRPDPAQRDLVRRAGG
jgi:hypothetical protein